MNSVQVKKIANGYTVTTFGSGAPPATSGATETYAANLAEVNALLDAYFSIQP